MATFYCNVSTRNSKEDQTPKNAENHQNVKNELSYELNLQLILENMVAFIT